jgi:hypothetical protein
MLERLARDKHTSLLGPFVSYIGNEVLEYDLYHTIGHNKQECYITIGWKGFSWTTI